MTGMQKAVFVKEVGKSLELGERAIPSPKDGDVLVKVTATMILPHDTYGRDWGLLINERIPAILGSNIAGTIHRIGPDVTSYRVGDRIFGISNIEAPDNDQAGLQQYAILKTDALCKTPERFADEQVVSLPTNLVTSWIVLFTEPGFSIPAPSAEKFNYSEISVVIIGGGTNVGKFAIQLASVAGIGNIIVIAGASNNDQLRSMGATHVIDRRANLEEIAKQVQNITGLDGKTFVYDCANWNFDLAAAIVASTKANRLRTLLPIEGEEVNRLKGVNAAFITDTNASMASQMQPFWTQVPKWLEERRISPTDYRVVEGLEKVKEIDSALDQYREGARAGPQTVVKI